MTAHTENDAVKDAILRKLRLDIGLLDSNSDPDRIAEIIGRIADCDLDDIHREELLLRIKGQAGTTLGALRRQLAKAVRDRRGRGAGQIEGMIVGVFGNVLGLEANAVTLIRQRLPGVFALDEFRQQPMVMQPPPWARPGETYPRTVTDADDAALLSWVQQQGVHLRGRPAIRTVTAEIIADHSFHPVRDYLDALQWDGVPRLDRWLITYLGAEDKPNYTTFVGPKWLISAVARIFRPGCIAKYVLLLLGPQDLGKSTALRVLGGEFYTDDISEIGTKDAAMQNAGVWLVELAELASTRKAHVDSVKAFVSRPIDRFRPPYGAHLVTRPRQSVLAGTINPSDAASLKDDTGNVRFWPVECTTIDLDALRRDRDQLWAEAVHRFRAGEKWWSDDAATIEAAREAQAAHSETPEDLPWFETIRTWIAEQERVVYAAAFAKRSSSVDRSIADRLRGSDSSFVFRIDEVMAPLGITVDRRSDDRITKKIAKILRHLGWKSGGVRLLSDSTEAVRRGQRATQTCNRGQAVRRWQRATQTCNRRQAAGTRCSRPLDLELRCAAHGVDTGIAMPELPL